MANTAFEKKETVIWDTKDESRGHYAAWTNPGAQRQVSHLRADMHNLKVRTQQVKIRWQL
jgi:hypothetical protein